MGLGGVGPTCLRDPRRPADQREAEVRIFVNQRFRDLWACRGGENGKVLYPGMAQLLRLGSLASEARSGWYQTSGVDHYLHLGWTGGGSSLWRWGLGDHYRTQQFPQSMQRSPTAEGHQPPQGLERKEKDLSGVVWDRLSEPVTRTAEVKRVLGQSRRRLRS